MCPSLTFCVQLIISKISKIRYPLKEICLPIVVLSIEIKFVRFLCLTILKI